MSIWDAMEAATVATNYERPRGNVLVDPTPDFVLLAEANKRADEEEERADGWLKYAKRLEKQVAQLEHDLAKANGVKLELGLKVKATKDNLLQRLQIKDFWIFRTVGGWFSNR